MTDLSSQSGNLSALIQIQTSKPSRALSSALQSANKVDGELSKDDRKTIEAAEKFEALLIHSMLKGMRKTTLSENTSNERAIYDDMLDEKLADTMIEAGGLGLAKQIINQIQTSTQALTQPSISSSSSPSANPDMSINTISADHSRLRELAGYSEKTNGTTTGTVGERLTSATGAGERSISTDGLSSTDVIRLRMASELWGKQEDYDQFEKQQQFLEPLIPHAKRNAQRLGTSHEAILAIAALETGWGQSMIKTQQGDNSFNLFGIKATAADGDFTQTTTTEFINGKAEKTQARFRVYQSSSDAVDGFANFVMENPRYSNALKHANDPERFLQELQTAGYATDPNYAEKAISVMHQIRNHSQKL
ncbi:MAG: flagellar assembly peptidoglycan hydrolase FlgJ [Granulosicoccus sp.]